MLSFIIGFMIKLSVLPLPIVSSNMDYSSFSNPDILVDLVTGGIFGIFASFVCICSNKLFYIILTQKETRIYEKKKLNIDILKRIISDFEIADFLYRLMLFRDSKFDSRSIQAFLNPEENKNIIKVSILKKLKIYMFISEIINPHNKIAYVWFNTLNAYISGQNKELVRNLWVQLKRGFELAKPKYLHNSSRYFNFDNSGFYKIPKGME